jgi:hypothetical protein
VGALAAHILTRERERWRHVEERRFESYMKLMELQGLYFWFTTAEMHSELVQPDTRLKCRSLAWQIADLLRAADEMEFLEEILDVTLGENFATARDRYDAMSKVIDHLGQRVNPRYAKKIREISAANFSILVSGRRSNAPGATSPF